MLETCVTTEIREEKPIKYSNICRLFFNVKTTYQHKGPGGSPALHGQDLKTRNLGFVFFLVLGRFRANSKLKLLDGSEA